MTPTLIAHEDAVTEIEQLRAENERLERELCRAKIKCNGLEKDIKFWIVFREDLNEWHGRVTAARDAVADLYHAMDDDGHNDHDDDQRAALERARKRLAEWGML